jgi:hypothetical protein
MGKTKAGDYAIAMSGLSDGDDLACNKTITVNYQKANATDPAVVWLDCDCDEHPNPTGDPGDQHFDTPTTSATGTCTFNLGHAVKRLQTGRTVTVMILNNNVEQKRDFRVELFRACPAVAHRRKQKDGGGKPNKAQSKAATKATKAPAEPSPITVDDLEAEQIVLRRGYNKALHGTFDRTFGRQIMAFVLKDTSTPGRPLLVFAKEAHTRIGLKKRGTWRITLPKSLWATSVKLTVRLVFVDRAGLLHNGYSFDTVIR